MDKNVVYPHNGILSGNKTQRSTDTWYKIHKPWKCNSKWKNPVTENDPWLHVHKISKIGKSIKTESRLEVTVG